MNARQLPPHSVYKLYKYKIIPTNGEKGIKWLNRAQRKTASNQSFLSLMPLLILNITISFPHICSTSSVPFWLEVSCQTREQLHSWSCISGTCLSRTAAFDFECSLFAFFPKFAIRNTLMSETSIVWFFIAISFVWIHFESQQSAITHFLFNCFMLCYFLFVRNAVICYFWCISCSFCYVDASNGFNYNAISSSNHWESSLVCLRNEAFNKSLVLATYIRAHCVFNVIRPSLFY